MIGFIIVCSLGVVSGVSLYREGAFTPAPPGGRPSCATKGTTFCENVDKYPTKIIQKLLFSKFTSLDDFFTDESEGLDEPPEYLLQEDMVPEEVVKRGRKGRSLRGNTSAQELERTCPVMSKTVRPQLAANSEREWRFIVQDAENNQTVVVQLCDPNEDCRDYCTQFHSRVPLVSVDPTGRFHKDSFWLPSSCICHAEPLDDIVS